MTIKEFSTMAGVSVQAIYKRLKVKGVQLASIKTTGTDELTDEGERILNQLFNKKDKISITELNGINEIKQELKGLKEENERLKEKLAKSQKREEELQETLRATQEALKAEQEIVKATHEALKAEQEISKQANMANMANMALLAKAMQPRKLTVQERIKGYLLQTDSILKQDV